MMTVEDIIIATHCCFDNENDCAGCEVCPIQKSTEYTCGDLAELIRSRLKSLSDENTALKDAISGSIEIPVKKGDTVYWIDGMNQIVPAKVAKVGIMIEDEDGYVVAGFDVDYKDAVARRDKILKKKEEEKQNENNKEATE